MRNTSFQRAVGRTSWDHDEDRDGAEEKHQLTCADDHKLQNENNTYLHKGFRFVSVAVLVAVFGAGASWLHTNLLVNHLKQDVKKDHCDSFRAVLAIIGEAHSAPEPSTYKYCKHVFIDGGSNKGDTIDAFVGIAENGEIDRKHRGEKSMRDRFLEGIRVQDVCYFGFEGNARWSTTLKEKEAKLTRQHTLKLIEIRTETVLLDEAKNLTFFIDPSGDSVGSSFEKGSRRDWQESHVTGVDLAAFIDQFDFESLFLKLDIEGAEYPILKKLMRQGQLCKPKKRIYLGIETHIDLAPPGYMRDSEVEDGLLNLLRCCEVVISRFWR